ncbi:MAG: hypothetical protein N3B68_06535 [Anaerolineae bacterium]|nr:hypothetical protein [Anaerolineae bacterium]
MKFWRLFGSVLLASLGVLFLLGLLPWEVAAGTTPPVNLSGTGSYARFPVIARSADGTLCAAWTDGRDRVWNIYYSCSLNNGRNWSSPGRVYSSTAESLHPVLLFSGTIPVFFWMDQTDTGFAIYQAISATVESVVSNLRQPAPVPSLALGEDGAFHLVFAQEEGVFYARRPAGGTWTSVTKIFTATTRGASLNPRIVVGPSRTLHVVWQEDQLLQGGVEIRYMTGTVGTGGEVIWSPSVTASNIVELAWGPGIAVTSGGDAHIVWTETIGDQRYLAYTRFSAAGMRTPPQRLGGPFGVNENNPYHLAPAVVTLGDRVCIAWNANPEGQQSEDLYLICSQDGGRNWSPPENLTRTPSMSLRPSLAAAPDGSLHVVWQEFDGINYDYHYRVYYTRWLPYSVYLPLVMRNAR